jgi:sugar phosphate isomerase/epimerase
MFCNTNLILFSTGVFINSGNNRDHTLLIKILPDIVSPGFEIFMSDYYSDFERQGEYEEKAKNVLQATEKGAFFHVMHMTQKIGTLISRNEPGDIDNALQIFEFNCGYAVKFGVKLLVLHLWGGSASDKNINVNIDMFPKLKEIADRYNLILTVENVVCNTHKPLDHMRKLWNLYGNNVKFTIDVRHAEFHKSHIETCESEFLWENNLVVHFHISDYGGGYMDWSKFLGNNTPITFGDVDFERWFSFLKSIKYPGSITIENNRISKNDDLVYNFNKSYEFIANGLGK